jgi:hypothetical protein
MIHHNQNSERHGVFGVKEFKKTIVKMIVLFVFIPAAA